MLNKLARRLRYILNRDERQRRLTEELGSHIQLHIDELMEEGMPREQAEARARQRFGNITRTKEESRAVWISRWIEDLVQDLRYGIRNLRRQPGFASVAVLSSALGIGTCSTIFGIANFALFRSLAVPEPRKVVTINGSNKGEVGSTVSFPLVVDLRTREHSFESVGAMFPMVPGSIGAASESRRNWGAIVTANYFDVLRLSPHLGRMFSAPQEDQPGTSAVIVLSHNVWRNQFGGDPGIVGKDIEFNGAKTTVIGVAPPGFRGHEVALVADFWIPMGMVDRIQFPRDAAAKLQDRKRGWLLTIARLQAGVTLKQAQADTAILAKQLAGQYPDIYKDRGLHVERAGQVSPVFRDQLALFFGVLLTIAVLVLLIACANVSNLLLARSTSRHREIATRLAIGASRGRLIRQLLVESILLALVGGAGGVAVARWGTALIGQFQLPISAPLDLTITLDYRVLIFAAGLSVLTGIAFGLVPALRATRKDLTPSLKNDPGIAGRWRRFSLSNALVVVQVAVSMFLLIASGLFLRSLSSAENMDVGMRARNVLFLSVDPVLNRYSPDRTRVFFETLATRVAGVQGVRSVSYTNLLPLSFITASARFTSEEKKDDPDKYGISAQAVMIGPRYFETLEIPFLRGQDFGSERPDGEPVVIVNAAFARKMFPGQDAVGRRVSQNEDRFRIAGVVATSKVRTIGEEPVPQVFQAVSQMIAKEDMPMGLTLAVKTEGPPVNWIPTIKHEVASLDPALAVFDVKTMQAHLRNAMLLPRLAALMFGLCGGMGLLIATIGLYGVISFSVARRTKEIGIRMALGARQTQVLGMVLRSGLLLTLIGGAIGLAVAFGSMRVAASLLYGISPSDPATYVVVPLVLATVAAIATLVPARRAAKLDPLRALRYE